MADASACGGERAGAQDDCFGAIWQEGNTAHLDQGDLLYHRKQARIVRRAVLVIVIAVAVVGHQCDGLLRAALEQAVDGVPVGIWYIYRPSYSPSGGVLLVPVGPREHGEPAGVAVLVLPSVGNNAILILMSKYAAARGRRHVCGWR
jgi:hypothetical protein